MERIEERSGANTKTYSAAGLQKRICRRSWACGEASEAAIQVLQMDVEDHVPQCARWTGIY